LANGWRLSTLLPPAIWMCYLNRMHRPLFFAAMFLLIAACGASAPDRAPVSAQTQTPLGTLADKRVAFARAYDAFRFGEQQRALPVFLALAAAYPQLADHALYFAGTIAMHYGDDAGATAAFTSLLREYPESVQAPAAALGLGKLLLRSEHLAEARPLLQRALTAPDKATAEAARLALAEADERQGNADLAYAGYMEVRRAMVGSAVARTAKQHVLTLRAQHAELVPAGPDLLDEAHLLLAEHDYAAAYRSAQELLQRPEIDRAEALRVEADALYGRGDVTAALTALRTLADRYPSSPAAPAALFRLASVLWNRDRDDAALDAFEQFERRYPSNSDAAEALYAIGRIHESAGRSHAALSSFSALARRYPQSRVADEARWRIGWILYRARQWPAAVDAFARVATETKSPRSRNQATYWQARAQQRTGNDEKARQLYHDLIDRDPADYYAMWAERRMGLSSGALSPWQTPPMATLVAHADAGSDLPALQPATAVDVFHFSRWGELKAAGVYRLAREELAAIEHAHRNDAATLRALLRANEEVDGFAAAQRLVRRLGDDLGLAESERQRLLYPLAFWRIVSRETRNNSLDPFLIEAVMRQESLFDPEARSSANAFGLMQLLPETATKLAAADKRTLGPLALFEADLNIDLGTRYLNRLLARFDGDLLKALAAYNGGEAAVDKWQRRFADLEPDEFVESISYRETRDYVKRVVTNYRTYQQLYAEPVASSAASHAEPCGEDSKVGKC
jgi:soluble lytic murein transglycosylase